MRFLTLLLFVGCCGNPNPLPAPVNVQPVTPASRLVGVEGNWAYSPTATIAYAGNVDLKTRDPDQFIKWMTTFGVEANYHPFFLEDGSYAMFSGKHPQTSTTARWSVAAREGPKLTIRLDYSGASSEQTWAIVDAQHVAWLIKPEKFWLVFQRNSGG
jgi:hypothetical protein